MTDICLVFFPLSRPWVTPPQHIWYVRNVDVSLAHLQNFISLVSSCAEHKYATCRLRAIHAVRSDWFYCVLFNSRCGKNAEESNVLFEKERDTRNKQLKLLTFVFQCWNKLVSVPQFHKSNSFLSTRWTLGALRSNQRLHRRNGLLDVHSSCKRCRKDAVQ